MKIHSSSFTKDRLYLLPSKTKDFSLKIRCDDGSLKTIHSSYDPQKEAQGAVNAFDYEQGAILIVLGLGLGYHLTELMKRFPQAHYLVVEPIPEIYEMAKMQVGIPQQGDNLSYLIGLPVKEVVKEITRHQINKGMPPISVYHLTSLQSCFPHYYQPLLKSLKNICTARIWEKIKYPKFKTHPCRIVLINFDYFLIREIENAVKSLGHKIVKVPIEKGENSSTIVPRLIDAILAFKPDFFLTVNHWGFDEEGLLTAFMQSIEMPVASWYVDSPNLIVKAFNKNASDYTSLFLWDDGYIEDMKSIGFEAVSYLPLATDEYLFKPLRLTAHPLTITPCDVGFVGNSMVGPAKESISRVETQHRFLIDLLAEEALLTRESFDDHLNKLKTAGKIRIPNMNKRQRINLEAAVLWKTTQLYRLKCVKKLKEFGVHIHGDKGWQELLNSEFNLFPSLSYYTELPYFYNACRINFNATSIQMGKAVNQRVFDVPACQAFLLTDNQEALGSLFEIGKEIAVYEDPEEIHELVAFYLRNPAQREQIASQGRLRVLKEHTYRHRLMTIIDRMKSKYG